MATGTRRGDCTPRHGAGAAQTTVANPALGSREGPGVVAGDRQRLRGPTVAPKGVLWCWAWLWGWVSAPRGGSGRSREGEGGLKTLRGASEMSGEVHSEGWQLLARRSAAAIGCPPSSCIFIHIHERCGSKWRSCEPSCATDPLLRPRVSAPTRGFCLMPQHALGQGRVLPQARFAP